MLKKISLVVLVLGYISAGLNHFINPSGYVKMIPHYLPVPTVLNIIAGICEIVFGIMLIFPATRNWAIWLLILMLAAFVPVHITMLQDAPLQLGKILVTPALAWLRLLLQPVLMLWLAWHLQKKTVSHI